MRKLPTSKRPKGAVIYSGPSVLTGAPIVVILTGLARVSRNVKTGPMVQAWILPASENPIAAIKSGEDASVCGDCNFRGTTCYVQVGRAPLQIWKSWRRGGYANWTKRMPDNALRDKRVRFGAYGDPAAVPYRVWRKVLGQKLTDWTGYTHQWRKPEFTRLRSFLMASADSPKDATDAWAQGWRTFRIRSKDSSLSKGKEIVCPASTEGGQLVTCSDCGLCKGQSSGAKNVAIIVHGSGTKSFEEN